MTALTSHSTREVNKKTSSLGKPAPDIRACLCAIDASAARLSAADSGIDDWAKHYHQAHRLRLARDLEIVSTRLPESSHILDLGCCPPLLTEALQFFGYTATGVDIAPERFTTTGSVELVKADMESERLPFEDARFDAVVFNEVFEHLRINPIRTISEIRRVLQPQGTLLMSTPNLRSYRGLLNLIRHHRGCHVAGSIYEEYRKLETLGHMGHVREYTAREVIEFLKAIGFRTLEVLYRDYEPDVGTRLERLACRIRPSLRRMFTLVCTPTTHIPNV